MMNGIEFANPYWFLLLALIPLLTFWYWKRNNRQRANIRFSSLENFRNSPKTLRQKLVHLPFALRMLCIAFLSAALARPQSSSSWQNVTTEGIDIVITMDISGSMLAEDFKPNRLEASKKVAMNFISGRPTDRMGLVVFAGEAFTQCPLTTDHSVLLNIFGGIKNGLIEDGTAIGMGLATAVKRLKDSEAKSKVIILLTDGVNTGGSIPPLTAAEIAKTFGIRVYTIGVGTIGMAPYPGKNMFGQTVYQDMEVKIDEDMMKKISAMTDGQYFRATDNNKLEQVYQQIDELEKSKIDVTEFRKKKEEFLPFALAALLLLASEILLRNTLLRVLP